MTASTIGRNGHVLVTQCPQGHAYTPENTGYRANVRYCRACNRAYLAAKRAAAGGGREHTFIDGEGLIDILAACVRQALADYTTGYDDRPHMSARDFLDTCGLLLPDGQVDWHGHERPTRIKRQP